MQRLRILLGDDHVLTLNGIKALLQARFDVVGTAAEGRHLVKLALSLKPDLVVQDVSMPQLNGLEAAKQIRAALPSAQIIFLTMHTNPLYLRKALEIGACGYVLKAGAAEELLDAIDQVLKGGRYISPGFGHDVAESLWNRTGSLAREQPGLTSRQREILQLIAEGRMSKEIAHLLDISIKTVDFHRARIMTRLGAHSIAELVRIAVEQGLLPASTSDAP